MRRKSGSRARGYFGHRCPRVAPRHPHRFVVGKVIGLDEPRGISRIPRSRQVMPLLVESCHGLEVMGDPLHDGDLERGVDQLAPRIVGLLVEDAAVRIDEAETDKGLVRTVGIDTVDIDQCIDIGVAAVDESRVHGDEPRELLSETQDILIHMGLGQVGIELDGRIDLARGRRLMSSVSQMPSPFESYWVMRVERPPESPAAPA